ncbi:MAG: N-acetylglucosamine kinase [Armatimonadota bacterium]
MNAFTQTQPISPFNESSFVAGFDGGGTKTVCLLTDMSGRPIGMGHGGPGNVCSHPDTAADSYRTAWREAVQAAGVKPNLCKYAVFGMAGLSACAIPRGPQAVIPDDIPAERTNLRSDMETALVGAVGTGPGVVVIAGTGSAACGQDGRGRFLKAGGWGYILDDEGGAFWIGKCAVRSVLDDYDGRGPSTAITNMLLAHLGLNSPPDLEGYVYNLPEINTGVAALAPIVVDAAIQGDAVALEILKDAGERLAFLAEVLLRRLGLDSHPDIPVATVGGVLSENSGIVRRAMENRLRRTMPLAKLIWPKLPPVAGAVILALQACGVHPNDSVAELILKGIGA